MYHLKTVPQMTLIKREKKRKKQNIFHQFQNSYETLNNFVSNFFFWCFCRFNWMSNDAEWKVYQKEIFHEFDGNCYWNSAHQFTFHDAITAVLEFIPFTMKFLSIFFSPQIGSELTFSEPIECIFWLCLFFFISEIEYDIIMRCQSEWMPVISLE